MISIREPRIQRSAPRCSLCNLYGHNRRRCHTIIGNDNGRELREDENFHIHAMVEQQEYERTQQRRRNQERRREQQQLQEQYEYNQRHINALQNQIRSMEQRQRSIQRSPPQRQRSIQRSPPQQPRPQIRLTNNNEFEFTLTEQDVIAFANLRSANNNVYKNLLSKPEALKRPVETVYISESCPICMESLGKTNVTTMLCGHQTCNGCFARNIIESKSNRCPTCREKVI